MGTSDIVRVEEFNEILDKEYRLMSGWKEEMKVPPFKYIFMYTLKIAGAVMLVSMIWGFLYGLLTALFLAGAMP